MIKLWDVRLWFTSSRWCSMPIEIRVIPEPCSSLPATSCRVFLVRTLLGVKGICFANKKHDYWIQINAFNNPPSPQAVYSLSTLYMKRFSQLDPPPPKKWGFWGILIKTRGGPVFLMHFAGGPEGVVKNMKNTLPFLIIYRKNHLAIDAL